MRNRLTTCLRARSSGKTRVRDHFESKPLFVSRIGGVFGATFQAKTTPTNRATSRLTGCTQLARWFARFSLLTFPSPLLSR
jgi:hypothetical protein